MEKLLSEAVAQKALALYDVKQAQNVCQPVSNR
jgi:hypothetical protein